MPSTVLLSTVYGLGRRLKENAVKILTSERGQCECGEVSMENLPKSTIKGKNERGQPVLRKVFWCYNCRKHFTVTELIG